MARMASDGKEILIQRGLFGSGYAKMNLYEFILRHVQLRL